MTVTQTWRVGPRSDKDQDRRREFDTGRTLTLHRKRLTVTISSRKRRQSQQRQELALGVNSFLLHGSGKIFWENGRKEGAAFEVEVNEAGAFYFGVRQSFGAKLNGRVCGWARLRFGDVIEVGEWSVRIEDSDYEAERTVVSRPKKGASKSPLKRKLVVAAGLIGVTVAGLAAAVVWYQGETALPSAPQETSASAPEEGASLEIETKELPALPGNLPAQDSIGFGEQEFDAAVRMFREGNEKAACELLRGASNAERKNIWTDKAQLFIKRRCGSL